jgi:hypothetical protein
MERGEGERGGNGERGGIGFARRIERSTWLAESLGKLIVCEL